MHAIFSWIKAIVSSHYRLGRLPDGFYFENGGFTAGRQQEINTWIAAAQHNTVKWAALSENCGF